MLCDQIKLVWGAEVTDGGKDLQCKMQCSSLSTGYLLFAKKSSCVTVLNPEWPKREKIKF